MAATIIKNSTTHAVVAFTRTTAGTDNLLLSALAIAGRQTATNPVVDISAVHITVPVGAVVSVIRNAETLWKTDGNVSLNLNGFADNRQNTQNIDVTFAAAGGTVILELAKRDGFGDNQHVNAV